ncbi:trans-aconitate 2-methyltransferase [Streptomyces phaeoluteigriseus]|uniref:Trans-aconitate 2-methyltransferase n=1 Tax=Streptomyces phaeoluteigriseus TaxID=114686 RepID=A0A1V6MTV0_9ACTN|nr:trans-aconitate 2-methyltransferase [Streptomyces phaeoluteigriseus]OQD55703.1 trans-aconitate methyltransferase [Streptomyces phaeoluteigriseus]USQ88770.1 trans-aconitate 2-methyltransferase [Streptomyces phaeoluteigriseus]
MPTPTWDPAQYLRHAGHRARPFTDLLARIPGLPGDPPRIADLGCGPGNVTTVLTDRWPTARVTGYDNSDRMLAEARAHAGPRLDFAHADLRTWTPTETYDLIVSNAALHWVPGHLDSFPAWLAGLAPGGTLAFQVPHNIDAPLHALMRELGNTPRWKGRLGAVLRPEDSVHAPEVYLDHLARLGCETDVWTTTYHHVLAGEDPVLDWAKGTGLRPVLTVLADDPEARDTFVTEYRDLLREAYPPRAYGTVLPFRRLFTVARKGA